MVVDPTEKLDVLWSFIKTHLKSKAMIFLSSCNQVLNRGERIFFERMTSGRKLKASREGSK